MEPCSYAHGRYEQRDRLNNNDQIKVQPAVPGKSYIWRDEGYTSCSASCLGGVEELIINCVREDDGKLASPYLCSPETKPENRIRTCNDIPCPPRWNTSEYSSCTKSCGIGIKTREINCIHEVTRGGENTMIVPNSMWWVSGCVSTFLERVAVAFSVEKSSCDSLLGFCVLLSHMYIQLCNFKFKLTSMCTTVEHWCAWGVSHGMVE